MTHAAGCAGAANSNSLLFFVVEIVVCFIQLIEINSNGIEFSLRLRGGGGAGRWG